MSNKTKGDRNELRSEKYLREQGYWVQQSKGSHGLVDLVGIYCGDFPETMFLVRLVQSKTNGSITTSEREALRMFAKVFRDKGYNVSVEIFDWIHRKRKPRITYLGDTPDQDVTIDGE